MKKTYDNQENYCRMLGHTLSFHYCRTTNENLPCRKVLDCWFEFFPVQQFIDDNYTKEEQKQIFAQPQPKILSLVSILENVQKQSKKQ